jgi:hypothetical protein
MVLVKKSVAQTVFTCRSIGLRHIQTDRRHDRRALSADEFGWFIEAARSGKNLEDISGPDLAMMYTWAS